MQHVLRPDVTAGVALVGASLITVASANTARFDTTSYSVPHPP